jgi:hypothetical protein
LNVYINKYVNLRFEYKYAKAGTVSFADFPIHWPYPKPFGTAVLASLERLPNPLALPKAFQTNAKRLFGFFNAHPLNQASLIRVFALKKPITL